MRILFSSLDSVKAAARRLNKTSQLKLSICQNSIAKAAGFKDWHELEKYLQSGGAMGAISLTADQISDFALRLHEESGAGLVDVCNSIARLCNPGNELEALKKDLDVRALCFRKTSIPNLGRREPGSVGRDKATGRSLILRKFGKPAYVISNASEDAIVADFEFITPKTDIPFFIPRRLYFPYGFWRERSGDRIIFSRDYLPLWRVSEGRAPEALSPALWIEHVHQEWFFGDAGEPWENDERWEASLRILAEHGVRGTPLLVEVLPSLIQDTSCHIHSAVEKLFGKRVTKQAA